MNEIVDWLRAQLDEDERVAERLHDRQTCERYEDVWPQSCTCDVPARVLREVAAKRAIVDAWVEQRADLKRAGLGSDMRDWGHLEGLASALEHLAAVYDDRPGYREEWKPL